jgi:hypothetical protein
MSSSEPIAGGGSYVWTYLIAGRAEGGALLDNNITGVAAVYRWPVADASKKIAGSVRPTLIKPLSPMIGRSQPTCESGSTQKAWMNGINWPNGSVSYPTGGKDAFVKPLFPTTFFKADLEHGVAHFTSGGVCSVATDWEFSGNALSTKSTTYAGLFQDSGGSNFFATAYNKSTRRWGVGSAPVGGQIGFLGGGADDASPIYGYGWYMVLVCKAEIDVSGVSLNSYVTRAVSSGCYSDGG